MSTCQIQASAAVELYFYDELDAAERPYVEQHLRTCADCRAALEELTVIRTVLASRPDVAAPPDGNWEPFMERLEAAVAREPKSFREPKPVRSAAPAREAGFEAAGRGTRHNVAAYFAMAAVLTLATSSVVYLARSRGARPPQATTLSNAAKPGADTAGPTPAPSAVERPPTAAALESADAAFASISEQHFERSKIVVLGIATKDPSEASAADWAHERQLASSLLDDTRLYRHAAQERGMKTLAGVLSDLELVLLQTSMSDERDAATLERIQHLIRKRDLMTKINAVTTAGI